MCRPNAMPEEPTPRSMTLVRRAATSEQGEADAAHAQWQGVAAALVPIVGQRGMLGLFRRSLALCQAVHPGLAAVYAAVHPAADLQSWRAALLLQPAARATVANEALLQTFVALLGQLIGTGLCAQLIGDFPSLGSGPAVEEGPS